MAGVGPARASDGAGAHHGDTRIRLARGKLREIDADIGAGDRVAPGGVDKIGGRRFQRFGREITCFVQRFFGRHLQRRAAGEERAARRTAEAHAAVGVALFDADALDRHVEGVHRQLRVARGNALAHGHGGGVDLDEAVGCDVHRHALFEHARTRPLQEGGQAAATQLAARLRRRTARVETGPVGKCEATVHHALELAAVNHLRHGVGVGHLLRAHHVAPAQRNAVDAELARGRVHQPLDEVDALGAARTAVGAGGVDVRHHRSEMQVDQRDVVDAGDDPGADHQRDDDRGGAGVGADVGLRAYT